MMDDIVEEVGEENIVQIVTDNVANYKLAEQMLMDKRNKLYWTPCAAHCIDIMLEYFEIKIPMHKEIIVSGYYLNPMLHYKPNFKADNEVKQGTSSGFERNWSAFEMVHTKKRNRLKQKTMNDLVYVMEENACGHHVNVAGLDEDLVQRTFAKSTAHVDEFDVHETIQSDNEEGNADEGDGGDDDDDYGGGDDEINEDEGVDIMGENSNYQRICDLY
ncbi:hypothetical protein KIW84_045005 [Lathyrus oleraceus]|uniref:DUF659 domain-containing protein n=1 Tax=Pisum sativum TaxID=3888 RepID=A0A9D4XM11_PEA|nr:hypothetical protein KIW84_045005 [Pisum sativum]